jgi:NadR type nicotinamide-nucleotide adenylyltransferase
MIRVVVTGSECTGKTTLAQDLAEHYRTVWVPEYARQFVTEKGAPPEYADVAAIARGQIELEDKHLATVADIGASLLIQDTDLLSTVVYSRHYYGDCPAWIEQAMNDRHADLYLLAGIDVPWVADGNLRDRGDRREEMHELFRRRLQSGGLRYLEISGDPGQRLRAATHWIDEMRDCWALRS